MEQNQTPTPLAYRGLSTKQPWAGMLAREEKSLEIRTRSIRYRGDIVILASQQPDKLHWLSPGWAVHQAPVHPLGVAVCLAELYDCRPMTRADEEQAQCPYEPGLYAWCLRDIRPVEPLPVKGGLGLLNLHLNLVLMEK